MDKCGAVSLAACAFSLIVFPILTFVTSSGRLTLQTESRAEPRIFWPAMVLIAIIVVVRNRLRFDRLTWPAHIRCLLAYLAFAGLSVGWAFSPQSSFVRFVQQAMVVTSIVLPTMLAGRTVDIVRGLFVCFACSIVLNVLFVLDGSVAIAQYAGAAVDIGYQGYFLGKNYLGECAAVAALLALREICQPGFFRRASGIVIFVVAILLLFLSDSKTALGLAFIAPSLAATTLAIRRVTRLSPATILLSIPLCYIAVSSVSNFNMNRISFLLYGDSTFTGRTVIWDFARYEIDRSPILGWGYQSFWLVGPNAPSVTDAPGWVKMMPNAHNGYYDTMLEMGYIGLALLLTFILATIHATGRVADRDPSRARILLSVILFIILYNFLESLWMRGFEFLWVVFVIVAAEVARYSQPAPLRKPTQNSRGRRGGLHWRFASPLPGKI
jgi:O-antigen ligase